MRKRRLGAVIGVAATALAAMTFTNVRAAPPTPPVFVNGALPPAPASGTVVNNDDEPGIAVTPDGKKLYTANGPSNDVTVVDAERLTVVKKIPVGQLPWGVALGEAP